MDQEQEPAASAAKWEAEEVAGRLQTDLPLGWSLKPRTILNDPPQRTYQASYINPRPRGTVSHACAGLEGGRLLEANRMALALGPLPGLDQ